MDADALKLKYSSLAAFIAHYELLKSTKALLGDEQARLDAMKEIVARLSVRERDAIDSNADGVARRQRERAERNLARELTARGILSA
ncbi:MAG TPA: hypothetical protein VGI47_00825 [Candidatus Binataceae bacterium]|jgi:hypothetical protein